MLLRHLPLIEFLAVTITKYEIEVTTPRSLEPMYSNVDIIADRTRTIALTAPEDYATLSYLKK